MQDPYMLALSGQVVLTATADKKVKNLLQTPSIQALNLGPGAVVLVQLGLTNESGTRLDMVNVPTKVIQPLQTTTIYDFELHTQLEREDADFEDLVAAIVKSRELHILVAKFATPQGMVDAQLPLQIQFTPNGFILNARLLPTTRPRPVAPAASADVPSARQS
ncbi:hypothetical protein [Deinococcus cellulosilyticus]|uniref:Uncharacterized protein n=1 Tax=Deinococcus cellulosilyticus (strain DSM 18568 / NBRC 106333 / KACC 11606 / 5516J-15) TaxID=1223518 RepID=A0A511NAX9_DEIC1|nr:hypothetical protein [Deinococcus cellulosilyticus]GEM49737.1 hypothetical protein DC3_53720 [Deinococcus cellulosilyticus NBRC 106333 = KACC 11606]